MENIVDIRTLVKFLPDLSGKNVLQFGQEENFLKVFKEQNVARLVLVEPNLSNSEVELIKSDFDRFELNDQKFDFVFLNSILKNLSDEQVLLILEKVLKTLNQGGHLFFREFCLEASSKRTPITFIDLVQSLVLNEESYDLVFAKPNSSFSSDTVFANTVSFLFTKIKNENHHGFKTLKEFMDHKQYSRDGILRYEKIFGSGFVSTGGIDTTVPFLRELNLQKGQKVLDVGCGIGGGDFLMAEKYDVEVLGIDLSSNMVGVALDRAREHQHLKTHFEIGDICKQKFPSKYFDLIYSRDTILHIADKKALFEKFKDWLKPGGKIFITDYCAGPKQDWTEEFAKYVEQRGYNLLTVLEYGDIFTKLGFKNVRAEDKTDLFVECLRNELKKMDLIKHEFVTEFTLEDFDYLVSGWKAKIVRCGDGSQKWGLFYCEK